ncbi:MAG: guanylate kinase [Gammaproteobacteria bacterium]|nr:guanylate kinase [Gammaproteobacteria bacterium]
MKMDLAGKLYVIAAPSGAGKTSLVKALVENNDALNVAISHTTRPRRLDEQDGVNYHFISSEAFTKMRQAGDFVEYAEVFNNQYGTSWSAIHAILATGKDIVLEIDWQGASQIHTAISDRISIFILPPSLETLKTRLQKRGQDGPNVIEQRMNAAVDEISHFDDFDFLVVNDNFDSALADLESIITGSGDHLSSRFQRKRLQNLLNSLLST